LSKVELFRELSLSDVQLAAIEALGWTEPTPIQWKAIPAALEGKDIVGVAQTGTGKTGAFMIPCLETIRAGGGLQVLVLCPTRELAQQVAEDTEALAKGTSLRAVSIVGGVSYGPQEDALSHGVEVIVATPGRFIDHMGKRRVDLSSLKTLILDEADRMLDMGFRPQIEDIRRGLRNKPQVMLFSATMPNGVHALALQLTRTPSGWRRLPSGTTADGITEVVYSVKPEKKPDLLLKLLGGEPLEPGPGVHPDQGGGRHPPCPPPAGRHRGRRPPLGSSDAGPDPGAGALLGREDPGPGGHRHRPARVWTWRGSATW
jgi:ATP-dependent RNA helicase RhlE